MERIILRIALRTPLWHTFDYLPPVNNSPACISQGMRVKVPFGKSERIGLIIEIGTTSDYDPEKLRHVLEVLDDHPLFPESILKLMHWASQYYHCPLGEVVDRALPSWLKKGNILIKDNGSPAKSVFEKKSIDSLKVLNHEQNVAVSAMVGALGQFKPFLLDGVTGSGKTEVYLEVIEKTLALGKQALLLVPEIGLAPQMLERIQSRFAVTIAILHSSISEKKRFIAWNMARTGEAKIIIGTRSAAFVPLQSPGVFILDEEHDPSFKQQDGFRYNARDLMIMRARLENCPVVLGSATPSLETLQNTDSGRYTRLRLPLRAGNAQPPNFQILDIRHKKLEAGLSSALIHEVKKALDAGGQALLFLNRRGFAPVLMCFDCGFVASCKHCDAKLTLHYQPKRLRCHHCDAHLPIYNQCPQCQSQNLNPLGVGTERLEATIQKHFPAHTVVRIDRDTTRRKGKLEESVHQIKSGEAHIILGTQMIAKGHHFPNVTLVAILDIDNALFSSDFRSTERLGQLLVQVAGRAGRETKLGTCFLQTCHPEHPLIKLLLNKGYAAFAEQLLMERRSTGLPPFSYQALIRSEAKTQAQALKILTVLKQKASSSHHSAVKALGPIAAPMEKRAGQFHAQLLLQSSQRSSIQALLKSIISNAETLTLDKKLRWSLDVDPIEMF